MPEQTFPEPTVGAFIFNRRGELLLLQSHKWPGRYVVPGGHVELGERLEEAVVREAKEETGLDVSEIEFINFQQFIHDPAFWKKRHFIFFDFACQTDDTRVQLNDEAEGFHLGETGPVTGIGIGHLHQTLDRAVAAKTFLITKPHFHLENGAHYFFTIWQPFSLPPNPVCNSTTDA